MVGNIIILAIDAFRSLTNMSNVLMKPFSKANIITASNMGTMSVLGLSSCVQSSATGYQKSLSLAQGLMESYIFKRKPKTIKQNYSPLEKVHNVSKIHKYLV